MRIARNFHDKGLKYVHKEVVNVANVEDLEKYVIYRGDVWEWAMYDKGENDTDYDLHYIKLADEKYQDIVVDGIVGPLFPLQHECTCGSQAVNGPAHSEWCDSLKDKWND